MHQIRLHAYRTLALAAAAAAVVLVTGPSTAMAQDHVYFLSYFDNAHKAGAPDGTLRLANDGNASESTLCANIYVFNNKRDEMEECCSCPVTPNTLLSLSVNFNVTGNPFTGGVLSRGLVEVVSSLPAAGVCEGTVLSPKAGVRGWLTHPEAAGPNGQYSLTAEQLTDSALSEAELTALELGCSLMGTIGVVGPDSAQGICNCPNDAGR
jgi:hypothetical protein